MSLNNKRIRETFSPTPRLAKACTVNMKAHGYTVSISASYYSTLKFGDFGVA